MTPQERKQDILEKQYLNEVLDSLIVEKQTFTYLVGQSGHRKEQTHDAETGTTLTLQ